MSRAAVRGRPLSPALWLGLALTLTIIAAGLVSLIWTPEPLTGVSLARRFAPPSWETPFGRDHFGRELVGPIMAGALNSLLVALAAVALGAGLGVPLGLLAAQARGWGEGLVMRLSDLIFAFPALLTAVMMAAIAGPSALNVIVAVGIFNVPVFARQARAAALGVLARDFIAAARTAGKGPVAIALVHVLPNIAGVLIVQATVQLALAILAESGLSYLGLGAPPPTPSWGRMLQEAQTFMALAPHVAIVPGLAIVLSVLGLNLLGDGLRDRLDPRLAGRA